MKKYTNKEIKCKVKEIFKFQTYSDPEIEIKANKSYIDIEISQEYTRPTLSFKQLNELAKFFDTLNIETESEFSNSGCDTCDYGSSYGFVLRISDGDPYKIMEVVDEN